MIDRFSNIGLKVKPLLLKMTTLIQYMGKSVVILTFLVAGYGFIEGVFDRSLIIEPLVVPSGYSKNGISGDLVAKQLNQRMATIRTQGWSFSKLSIVDISQVPITEDVVFLGISLNTVISLTRKLFGVRNQSVQGNLYKTDKMLHFHLTVSHQPTIELNEQIESNQSEYQVYQQLINQAAKRILSTVDPFALASYHWANGETDESIVLVKRIVDENRPESGSAYLLWGEVLSRKGEYQAALSKFEQATAYREESALAYNGIGSIFLIIQEYSKAIEAFKKAIHLKPDFWEAWYQWGQVMLSRQDYSEAVVKFNTAIATEPSRSDAYNELSYAYLHRGEIDNAITAVLSGIKVAPQDELLYATASEHYWANKDKKKSFYYLNQAIEKGFDISPYIEQEPYKSFILMAN